MHIIGDFSGLLTHLMLNAKEQQYLKPEVLILSSTIQCKLFVGQLSDLGIIPGYKSLSNLPSNNLLAHNGHRVKTFKCTKSLVKYIAINNETAKILGNLCEFQVSFHCKVIFQRYLFISHVA